MLRHLGGVGVYQGENLELLRRRLDVQPFNQRADLVDHGLNRVDEDAVTLVLDVRRRAAEDRMLIRAIEVAKRPRDGLRVAVLDLEGVQLRRVGLRALVPKPDRALDFFPVRVGTDHDQKLRLIQGNHLIVDRLRNAGQPRQPPAAPARPPAPRRRPHRARVATEQFLDELRHAGGLQVLELDDVPRFVGRGHVQLPDQPLDPLHLVALGEHVERVLGRIRHDARRATATAQPARGHAADQLGEHRRDVLDLGLFQRDGLEVLGQRLVQHLQHLAHPGHTLLVGVDNQRVHARVRHDADGLLGPLEDALGQNVLRRAAGLHRAARRLPPGRSPPAAGGALLGRADALPARCLLTLLLLEDLVEQVGNLDGVGVLDLDDVRVELADVRLLVELLDQCFDLRHLVLDGLDDDRVGPLVGDHEYVGGRSRGATDTRYLGLGAPAPAALQVDARHRPAAGHLQEVAHQPLDVSGVRLDVENLQLARVRRADVDELLEREELPHVAGQRDDLDLVAVHEGRQQRIVRQGVQERVDQDLRLFLAHPVIHDDEIHVARVLLLEGRHRGVGLGQRDPFAHLVDGHDPDVMLLLHEAIALLVQQPVQLVDRLLFRELAVTLVGQRAPDDQLIRIGHERLADPVDEVRHHVFPRHVHEVEPLLVVRRGAALARLACLGLRLRGLFCGSPFFPRY